MPSTATEKFVEAAEKVKAGFPEMKPEQNLILSEFVDAAEEAAKAEVVKLERFIQELEDTGLYTESYQEKLTKGFALLLPKITFATGVHSFEDGSGFFHVEKETAERALGQLALSHEAYSQLQALQAVLNAGRRAETFDFESGTINETYFKNSIKILKRVTKRFKVQRETAKVMKWVAKQNDRLAFQVRPIKGVLSCGFFLPTWVMKTGELEGDKLNDLVLLHALEANSQPLGFVQRKLMRIWGLRRLIEALAKRSRIKLRSHKDVKTPESFFS